AMNIVLDILNEPDLCSLLPLLLLLWFVGNLFAQEDDWGHAKYVGYVAFLAYVIYGCAVFNPVTAGDFLWITLRAVIAAALALVISIFMIAPLRRLLQKK